MFNGAVSSNHRRQASLLQFIYVITLLLSASSTALANIPLPRPRPADIPGDQSRQSIGSQPSQCQQHLAGFAEFKALPPVTGPGECTATDVVELDTVILTGKRPVVLSPPAVLRCPMADTVAVWLRDDVAPAIATTGTSLREIETLDSFVCRRRNYASEGKISEHGRANALDVRALKLADGRTIALTDVQVSKSLRENLRQSACARFTTVLGNGADAYHESHVHLDLLERSNKYRICQWDVLDVAESAALAAKKAIAAAAIASDVPLPRPRPVAALAAKKVIAAAVIASDVPLPRPRPVLNHDISTLSQRRHEHFREAGRGSVFDFMTSLLRYAR